MWCELCFEVGDGVRGYEVVVALYVELGAGVVGGEVDDLVEGYAVVGFDSGDDYEGCVLGGCVWMVCHADVFALRLCVCLLGVCLLGIPCPERI